MYLTTVFALLGTFGAASGETHSLSYIYTAFSKPAKPLSIPEFTGIGFLDKKMIDYYDSVQRKKVPKQKWMEERMEPSYWEKGTESRLKKEQWFGVNLGILMKRMRHNNTGLSVLQWQHGCEVEVLPDNSTKFSKGIDSYSYNGDDFISFDGENKRWLTGIPEAQQTTAKWNEVQPLNDYTKNYLETECVKWLEVFLKYGKKALQQASPPEVYVFTTESKVQTQRVLNCMATGFYPEDVIVQIKRNDYVLTPSEGLKSTGVRPNEDETFQIRLSVEILKTDSSVFECEVIHQASNVHIVKKWDGGVTENTGIAVALALALVAVAAGVGVCVVVMRRLRKNPEPEKTIPPACTRVEVHNGENECVPLTADVSDGEKMKGSQESFSKDSGRSSGTDTTHSSTSGLLSPGDGHSVDAAGSNSSSSENWNQGTS
ncbi:class I histocompatibility antigen, F10 alpha chain-like isoform X2 [Lampris incognitus]|uniref:class I histocompatibility antigen, F10 alpha chain-like isoform X2 n=1 Tax=Lampris incognitus TaxID=2546036 RepID=UPI0024B49194|nr:class I histocompatibility antigen, F10 alpha chain-like isoform X2 [Lampris incognitus]